MSSLKRWWHLPVKIFFWLYHGVYAAVFLRFILLAFTFMGLLPILSLEGQFPWHLVIIWWLTAVTPLVGLLVGVFWRKDATKLAQWFFGVELPVMGLCGLTFLFVRQLSPSVSFFIATVLLGWFGLTTYLVNPKWLKSKWGSLIILLTQQSAVVVAGYVMLLTFFLVPIILAAVASGFFELMGSIVWVDFFEDLWEALSSFDGFVFILLALLVLATMFFFFLTPFIAIMIVIKAAKRLWRHAHTWWARPTLLGLSTLYCVGIMVLAIGLSWQSKNQQWQARVAQFSTATTFEEQQQAAARVAPLQQSIKQELVTTYLSPYRYLTDSNMNFIKMGYVDQLHWSDERATQLQQAFNTVALPFVYQGSFTEEVKQATEQYQQLFDTSILEGEQAQIAETLKATNVQDELKAGILDQTKDSVKLVKRQVTTESDHPLLARITIEEEYENVTDRQQEVYYELSLPAHAVMTELVLGPDLEFGSLTALSSQPTGPTSPANPSDGAPLPDVHQGQVAPKGAAETTYEAQVRERIDPAMLQQVGPQQYKLRVFPIPVQLAQARTTTDASDRHQKVRYSYVTVRSGQVFHLPTITQSRNVFSAKDTQYVYTVNGVTETLSQPLAVTVPNPGCATQPLSVVTNGGAMSLTPFSADPAWKDRYNCQTGEVTQVPLISNKKIAILVDVSASNSDWREDVRQLMEEPALNVPNNEIKVYFFNTLMSRAYTLTEAVNEREITAIGQTDRVQALAAVEADNDAVFMLSDLGGSELKPVPHPTPTLSGVKIYLIHPDGIPAYSELLTQYSLARGVEVSPSLSSALYDYALTTAVTEPNVFDVSAEGIWKLQSNSVAVAQQPVADTVQSWFLRLATQRLIMWRVQAFQGNTNLSLLDGLNAQAQAVGIVTPYSSLIALVNQSQKDQLEAAMKRDSRYQVQLPGDDQIGDPAGADFFASSGVPEPEEWLLLATGIFMAGWWLWQRRQLSLLHA